MTLLPHRAPRSGKLGGVIVTYGAFPLVFGASLVLALVAIAAGWDLTLAVAAINTIATGIVIVLERLHPYAREWNRSRGDVLTDASHMLVSMVALPLAMRAVLFGGLMTAGAWLVAQLGMGLWPTAWPLLLQLLLALLIGELGAYWIHRAMHTVPFLWRIHAVHHSAPRLYWLNASRVHPVDTFGSHLLQMAPLLVLGCPEPVLFLFLVFTGVHGVFQHCNVELRLGPLNWFFSMAELHRWHHSPDPAESNTNYGGRIILWDLLFGTFFWPRDHEPPVATGFEGDETFPSGYVDQLLSPIAWPGFTRPWPSSSPAPAERTGAGGRSSARRSSP